MPPRTRTPAGTGASRCDMRSHCVSEVTGMEGRNDRMLAPGECSALVPAPGMRCWQRRGGKPRRKPEDRGSIPRLQARERPERAKEVNPSKLRYPELRRLVAAPEHRTPRWGAAVVGGGSQ